MWLVIRLLSCVFSFLPDIEQTVNNKHRQIKIKELKISCQRRFPPFSFPATRPQVHIAPGFWRERGRIRKVCLLTRTPEQSGFLLTISRSCLINPIKRNLIINLISLCCACCSGQWCFPASRCPLQARADETESHSEREDDSINGITVCGKPNGSITACGKPNDP